MSEEVRGPGAAGAASTAGDLVPVEHIRAAFPALERVHGDRPVAYFDGPGGTQVPRSVAGAVSDCLLHHNANAGWAYPTSVETDAILDGARRAMADFLGCAPDEVAFGANMTTLTFHVSRAIGRGLAPDAEIVVTELDHHANVDPWREMARDRGLVVHTVPLIPDRGTLDYGALESLLSPRTGVVAVGIASNALGTVNDLPRIADLARSRTDALLFADAVHSAAHELVDVADPGFDFLVCSPYKFYGPHAGVLYGRRDLVEALDIPRLLPAPDASPERLETGTLNHEGIAGVRAAVDFLASLAGWRDLDADAGARIPRVPGWSANGLPEEGGGHVRRPTESSGERFRGPESARRAALRRTFEGLHARGESLFAALWEGLDGHPAVRLYGPPPGEPRTPTLAFAVEGLEAREVARRLAGEHGVYCSHGDFYASTVIERLGMTGPGLVRAGCACYTTAEETDRLVEGVLEIAETRGG